MKLGYCLTVPISFSRCLICTMQVLTRERKFNIFRYIFLTFFLIAKPKRTRAYWSENILKCFQKTAPAQFIFAQIVH